MKVEKLTQSKKSPDRWYLEFENGDKINVNIALISDFALYTGRELDGEEYEALLSSAQAMAAKSRALRIIGTRMMSRGEIVGRLREKGETDEAAEEAADWMERMGFLNDGEYAAALTRHYAAKGYGTARIKDEFYRRKIPRELWEGALAHMPETDGAIDDFIKTRLRNKEPDRRELKKVTDALLRRGFSWSEIRPALSRYEEYREDFEE